MTAVSRSRRWSDHVRATAFLPTGEDDPDVYTLGEGERRGPPTFRNP